MPIKKTRLLSLELSASHRLVFSCRYLLDSGKNKEACITFTRFNGCLSFKAMYAVT